MTFNPISRESTCIPSHISFSPPAPLSIRRGGLANFPSQITIKAGSDFCGGICEKVSDFCWQQWMKVRIYTNSVFNVPATSRQEVLTHTGAFKARLEQCPNTRADKEQLVRDFKNIPSNGRRSFVYITEEALMRFAHEANIQKAEKMRLQMADELNYIQILYPRLNRGRAPGLIPPPVTPNPPALNPFVNTPFAVRNPRIAASANEPSELLMTAITPLQRQRGQGIAAMKMFIPDDYKAPGDAEALKDKYICAIGQVDGPLGMPIFHDQIRQDGHHVELAAMRAWIGQPPRLRNCAICRASLTEANIFINISMQKMIADKLAVALDAMADPQIIARLQALVVELMQEVRPDGTVRTITRNAAKAKLVTLILDLPEDLNGKPLFARIANLYMQNIHAT